MERAQARQLALNWLARREHSPQEIHNKLIHRGCSKAVAATVTTQLEAETLLSEERFIESLIRVRRNRGFGPLRIQKELHDKGVSPDIIDSWVDVRAREWIEAVKEVRRKKFGSARPKIYAERAKQARFLQYRGFTYDQIQQVLDPRKQE